MSDNPMTVMEAMAEVTADGRRLQGSVNAMVLVFEEGARLLEAAFEALEKQSDEVAEQDDEQVQPAGSDSEGDDPAAGGDRPEAH